MADPALDSEGVTVYQGDALTVLRELPAQSVHTILTSPPYFALRDYNDPHQIGLEDTPEEYISNIVTIFREARRVLRDDGTCWIVLGDSYAASRSYQVPDSKHTDVGNARRAQVPLGLKAKDQMLIPARVALALQQPWYAGRLTDERDRIWLAAMLDAEGCIFVHRRPAGQSAYTSFEKRDGTTSHYVRTADTFGIGVEVSNTCAAIPERCLELAGCGSITATTRGRNQRLYRWHVRGNQARELLRELHPHLIAKAQQARIAYACPTSGDRAAEIHEALKTAHRTGTTTVDADPPPTCFEPGWYLRKDIIFSKPNPMPESVRDRPTSSHEHVLMLAKSERYYYDQAAALEAYRYDGRRQTLIAGNGAGSSTHANYANRRGAERWPRRSGNSERSENHQPANGKNTAGGVPWVEGEGRNLRDVWTIPTEPTPLEHYATYPQALCDPVIRVASPAGGVILDMFFGSGTTGLVARRLGRRCIGIELNESYVGIAAKRLAMPDYVRLAPESEPVQLQLGCDPERVSLPQEPGMIPDG